MTWKVECRVYLNITKTTVIIFVAGSHHTQGHLDSRSSEVKNLRALLFVFANCCFDRLLCFKMLTLLSYAIKTDNGWIGDFLIFLQIHMYSLGMTLFWGADYEIPQTQVKKQDSDQETWCYHVSIQWLIKMVNVSTFMLMHIAHLTRTLSLKTSNYMVCWRYEDMCCSFEG